MKSETRIEIHALPDGHALLRVRGDPIWRTDAVDVIIPRIVGLFWLLGLHDVEHGRGMALEVVDPMEW